MNFFIILTLLISTATAFTPMQQKHTAVVSKTKLMMEPLSRRDLVTQGLWIAGLMTALDPVHAFEQQLDPYEVVSSQQYTGGKIDLNSAFVVSTQYM
jgi:hypothetical protein